MLSRAGKHGQQEAHLEPGSDVKMLLHVSAQHLIYRHYPELSNGFCRAGYCLQFIASLCQLHGSLS